MTAKIFRVDCFHAPMMTEVGSWWDVQPWRGNKLDCTGGDDGGHDYELPDEYEVVRDPHGMPHIYGPYGIDPIHDLNGQPVLYIDGQTVELKRSMT